jgi:hypothetical protein
MGWLYGWNSRRALVDHLLEPFSSDDKSVTTKPLAHCFKGNNMWTVWERVRTGTKTVTLAPGIEALKPFSESYRYIVLFYLRRNGSPAEWGYKDVSEDMGLCEVNCPPSYLEMAPLGSHHGEYAISWREGVKAYWARAGRDLGKDLVDGQAFRANGLDYVFRPWTPGYRVYRGYIIGERNFCRYRVKKADVELPVPVAETASVALETGGQTDDSHESHEA